MINETTIQTKTEEIKNKLFGNLEVNVIKDPENPEKVTFERVMHKFERANIYIEYSLKDNEIHQIFKYNHKKMIKVLYPKKQNISDSQELNKYNLRK